MDGRTRGNRLKMWVFQQEFPHEKRWKAHVTFVKRNSVEICKQEKSNIMTKGLSLIYLNTVTTKRTLTNLLSNILSRGWFPYSQIKVKESPKNKCHSAGKKKFSYQNFEVSVWFLMKFDDKIVARNSIKKPQGSMVCNQKIKDIHWKNDDEHFW